MMKRMTIMLLCAACISACMGTAYFEPDVVGTSDSEETIPFSGGICWFQVEYRQVMTRFQPGKDFKPFRYVVAIEGMESSDPTVVEHDMDLVELTESLAKKFPEFYEEWQPSPYWSGVIAFAVPANLTQDDRKVEVKVSIADGYHNTQNWGEWETVFEGTQAGLVMPSHSLEKSQANIFEPVRINMHKCDEVGNLSWYRLNGICDSLIWSVKGLEGSQVVMNTNKETIYFGHRFTLPGEYESVLSAYKDNKVIYEDVKNITITDDKDFLMFDWEEVISGNAQGEAYLNVLNPDMEFGSIVKCEDGNPQILIYVVPSDRLTPEDERRILYDYMCELYYVPTVTGNGQAEWATDTSVARLVNTYNEFTETDEWRIIAEPLRK